MFNYVGSIVTLTNTAFSQNFAQQIGGGIYNRGTLTITGSALVAMSANISGGVGGAIYNGVSGSLTLNGSTLAGNSAHAGGAIMNEVGSTIITNSTLSDNTATSSGGSAILVSNGTVTITNSTLAGNSAATGAAIYNAAGTTRLKAAILSNLPTANCQVLDGSIVSDGYNITDDGSCSAYLAQPSNQNGVNPLLGALADNGGTTETQALQVGSLAIDALPALLCGTGSDQRGISRPQGSACDIGAYEAQTGLPAPTGLGGSAASDTAINLHWTDTFNET